MEHGAAQSAQDFSWSETAKIVLAQIDRAFSTVDLPVYFTNVDHCRECRDHHEELSARPRAELLRSDLGHMSWDPITFAIPQGVAYLMPTLARYTMGPVDQEWYAEQMVLHLTYEEESNRLLLFSTTINVQQWWR